MARAIDMPKFGPLAGVRIVNATQSTAGGFANSILAEMGADVIWLESPQSTDPTRGGPGEPAQCERRNMRNICFDITAPEGKQLLLDLLKTADIFMEASKGDHYAAKWGLTDEALWEVNPDLIIVHMTGFGVEGNPAYIRRPSFDGIAQAYTGYINMQGVDGELPPPAAPQLADYYYGLFAANSALAALYRRRVTGEHESIDCAQVDCVMRISGYRAYEQMNYGSTYIKEGSRAKGGVGWGVYKCMDGKYVYMLHLGPGAMKAGLEIAGMGEKYGTPEFPVTRGNAFTAEPQGAELERRIEEICATHTAKEVEELYWPKGVPCCRVMDYEDLENHPHVQARGSIIEWECEDGRSRRGAAPVPRFTKNPTYIWRGCPGVGQDNEDILGEIGYSEDKIKELYDSKIVTKLPIRPAMDKAELLRQGYTESMFKKR